MDIQAHRVSIAKGFAWVRTLFDQNDEPLVVEHEIFNTAGSNSQLPKEMLRHLFNQTHEASSYNDEMTSQYTTNDENAGAVLKREDSSIEAVEGIEDLARSAHKLEASEASPSTALEIAFDKDGLSSPCETRFEPIEEAISAGDQGKIHVHQLLNVVQSTDYYAQLQQRGKDKSVSPSPPNRDSSASESSPSSSGENTAQTSSSLSPSDAEINRNIGPLRSAVEQMVQILGRTDFARLCQSVIAHQQTSQAETEAKKKAAEIEIDMLKQQVADLTQNVQNKTQEHEYLKSKLNTVQYDRELAIQSASHAERKVRDIMRDKEDENNAKENNVDFLAQHVAQQLHEIVDLKHDLKMISAHSHLQEGYVHAAYDEHAQTNANIKLLEHRFHFQHVTWVAREGELLDELDAAEHTANQDYVTFRDRIHEDAARIEELETDIKELQDELNDAKTQSKAKDGEIAMLKNDGAQMRELWQAANVENGEHLKEIEELEEKLEAEQAKNKNDARVAVKSSHDIEYHDEFAKKSDSDSIKTAHLEPAAVAKTHKPDNTPTSNDRTDTTSLRISETGKEDLPHSFRPPKLSFVWDAPSQPSSTTFTASKLNIYDKEETPFSFPNFNATPATSFQEGQNRAESTIPASGKASAYDSPTFRVPMAKEKKPESTPSFSASHISAVKGKGKTANAFQRPPAFDFSTPSQIATAQSSVNITATGGSPTAPVWETSQPSSATAATSTQSFGSTTAPPNNTAVKRTMSATQQTPTFTDIPVQNSSSAATPSPAPVLQEAPPPKQTSTTVTTGHAPVTVSAQERLVPGNDISASAPAKKKKTTARSRREQYKRARARKNGGDCS